MPRKMPAQKPHRSEQAVETPDDLLTAVRRRFGPMAFDLAATKGNAKAPRFFTPEDNALQQDWAKLTGHLWLNPEFGDIPPWVAACVAATTPSTYDRSITVLITAGVGTEWWRHHVHGKAYVLHLAPRVTFVGHKHPFPKDLSLLRYGGGHGPGTDLWRWK
jgi:phage N-6-adenine-methyltransferase